ncbi:cyclic nucleotide-binding/CBS domain-containing protein [Candidatus Borrarchaeum sp.]|uniref:CBS domain-containing protein n=1 Tax=Candidatus Borrarchaeum sp. TaxID=2846742 RepID=UPI00257D0191|nr:CBS domain-containing protein [Candidatus Borrarchaeum sp.]
MQKKLPLVSELPIHDEYEAVNETMSVLEAAKLMKTRDITDLVVISEEHKLSGIVMESDIIRKVIAVEEDPSQVTIKQIMEKTDPLSEETDVMTATQTLIDRKVPIIPIVQKNDQKLLGVLTINDCLLALKEFELSASKAIEEK